MTPPEPPLSIPLPPKPLFIGPALGGGCQLLTPEMGELARPRLMLEIGAALQADGDTRSPVERASSIRRRSAAWSILPDWTYRSRRPASALWMTQARSFAK